MLQTILLVVQVLVSLMLIGLVLIQKGKGADAGAGFGAGASGTVFGAKGSGNFLSRSTAILATVFILNSLWLANLAGTREAPESILEGVEQPAAIGDEGVLPELEMPLEADDSLPAMDDEMPQLESEPATEVESDPAPEEE